MIKRQRTQVDVQDTRTEEARNRYRKFVMERIGIRQTSAVRVVLGLLLCATLVLIPAGIALIIRGLSAKNPHKQALENELDFIDRADLVMASAMMVNASLRSPGDTPCPGLFLVSFAVGETQQMHFIADVMSRIEEPAAHGISPADIETVEMILADLDYQRGRRRRLPTSFTHGHVMYVCDIAIYPWYLIEKHISDEAPLIPCLAEPGDQGEVRPIPYWCAFDTPPPPWASNTQLAVM